MKRKKIFFVLVGIGSLIGMVFAEKSKLAVDLAIGTGVENRKLVGESEKFDSQTPQVVGWTKITGAQEPTEIRHVWKFEGKEQSSVILNVQSSSFRTHSRKNIYGKVGHWTLDVIDVDGNVLASKKFEVTAVKAQ